MINADHPAMPGPAFPRQVAKVLASGAGVLYQPSLA
jgi:hypothetical protein